MLQNSPILVPGLGGIANDPSGYEMDSMLLLDLKLVDHFYLLVISLQNKEYKHRLWTSICQAGTTKHFSGKVKDLLYSLLMISLVHLRWQKSGLKARLKEVSELTERGALKNELSAVVRHCLRNKSHLNAIILLCMPIVNR